MPYRLLAGPGTFGDSAAALPGGTALALFAWGFGVLMFELALGWPQFLHTESPLLREVMRLAAQQQDA